MVPQAATYEQQGNIILFKLNKDNKVATSIIKVKASIDNLYVVASGVELNDKIIASGVGKLRNGMAISPKETSFEEALKPVATLFKN